MFSRNQRKTKDFRLWAGNGPGALTGAITGPAGIFKFMLDLVSDNEIDGLVDLIPKL